MKNHPRFSTQSSWVSKYWQDLPLGLKGVALNALPLMVLLASLAFLYTHEQQAALLENKVQNALQIQRDIQTVHTQLLEASTGVRDFLLTGNENFLTIYHQAQQKLPLILQELALKLDDEQQHARLLNIIPLVNTNLADLNMLASNQATVANDLLIEKFSQQSQTLDSLRAEIEAMSVRESLLVAEDRRKVSVERQRNIQLTLLAAIIGILGSFAGAWIFSGTIVNRVRHIRDSAAHLARGEALALPSISSDELGQLTEELEHASQLLTKSANEAHQARIEAEEASAAKSTFLSRTSHELRTPLNAILGFAQILENDLPAGRQKDSASLIIGAGKHLLKLINEVLDIARIESGDMAMEYSQFDLTNMLEEAINFIRPMGKIRDIDIKTHYPDGVMLYADRQKLMQVVLNLLSNALKYGPENSTVTLNAYVREHTAIIEISDEGRGIPEALKSRLFTPFDRLGAETTMTEGTGLGLALSKQIMDALGGSIHLATQRSMFWLALPIQTTAVAETDLADHPKPANIHIKGNKQNILYVEDNASNRALLGAIIARHSQLKLHFAATLKDAKAYLNDLIPDIILIDLHLPDGSGESLVHYINNHASYQHIPIIILSADALPDTISRLKALGVAAYFTKPLDIAAFNHQLNVLITES